MSPTKSQYKYYKSLLPTKCSVHLSIKAVWSTIRVDVGEEHDVLVSHVVCHLTLGIVAGDLRVSFSLAHLAYYAWLVHLNYWVTYNIHPLNSLG